MSLLQQQKVQGNSHGVNAPGVGALGWPRPEAAPTYPGIWLCRLRMRSHFCWHFHSEENAKAFGRVPTVTSLHLIQFKSATAAIEEMQEVMES